MCVFFQSNSCKNGASCSFAHVKESQAAPFVGYDPRDDAECQICLDKVLLNKKQFGVLDNCDHVFCLKCIRSWRATYDQRTTKHHYRTCPICRQTSYLVVPSYFHATGSDKEALIDEYKGHLKEIPCKHFNKGRGECPFRDSCNYSHIDKEGNHFEYGFADDKIITADGEVKDDYNPTLAERIGLV